MSKYIEFKNVSFAYSNDDEQASRNILENFDFSVNKGEFVAVLGHNGCGKSTVAKLCNGIEIPQGGSVTVDGIDTSDEKKIFDIRRKVGMVFQNPDNQLVATIVEDDVAFGPENLGVEPTEIRKRVDNALKSVGMYDFRNFEPHKLSGGQKQRVAIAGILAMEPECIIFDESTSMLDPVGRREVMESVKKFHREGITIVFITHYMDEAAQAQRVVVMDKGKIILDGSPVNVFSHEDELLNAKLDIPEITKLAHILSNEGYAVNKDALNVDELADSIIKANG